MSDQHPETRLRAIPPRVELGLGVLAVWGGLSLRLWRIDLVALTHYDEGVYASNLWFPSGAGYPARELYAPPLLPGLIELCQSLWGAGIWQPLLPTLAAGILLPVVGWWVARRWFGPVAGLLTLVLVAMSPTQVLFSRSALTDSPVTLWLLMSVAAAREGLTRRSPLALGLAATCAALAWWTKWSGWLSLAITGAALPPWLWCLTRRHPAQSESMAGVSRETTVRQSVTPPIGNSGGPSHPGKPNPPGPRHADETPSAASSLTQSFSELKDPVSGRTVGSRSPTMGLRDFGAGDSPRSASGDVAGQIPSADRGEQVSRETPRDGDGDPRVTGRPRPVSMDGTVSREAGETCPNALDSSTLAGQATPRVRDPADSGGLPGEVPARPQSVSRETPILLAGHRRGEVGPKITGGSRDARVSRETSRGAVLGPVLRWAILAVATLLAWFPCWWDLQASGGYGPIAANHRTYLVGRDRWFATLRQQGEVLQWLDTQIGVLIPTMACLLVLGCGLGTGQFLPKSDRRRLAGGVWRSPSALAALALALGLGVVGPGVSSVVLASLWLIDLLRPINHRHRTRYEMWLLAAWLGGLSVSLMQYRAFPRLTLPWLVATSLASAAWLVGGGSREEEWGAADRSREPGTTRTPDPDSRPRLALSPQSSAPTIRWMVGATVLWLVAVWQWVMPTDNRPARGLWPATPTDQRGMAVVAEEIVGAIRAHQQIPPGQPLDRVLVYTQGEPAVLHHLRRLGVAEVRPIQKLSFAQRPGPIEAAVFVVSGERTWRQPGDAEDRSAARYLNPMARWRVALPPIAWFDEPPLPAPDAGSNDQSPRPSGEAEGVAVRGLLTGLERDEPGTRDRRLRLYRVRLDHHSGQPVPASQ